MKTVHRRNSQPLCRGLAPGKGTLAHGLYKKLFPFLFCPGSSTGKGRHQTFRWKVGHEARSPAESQEGCTSCKIFWVPSTFEFTTSNYAQRAPWVASSPQGPAGGKEGCANERVRQTHPGRKEDAHDRFGFACGFATPFLQG